MIRRDFIRFALTTLLAGWLELRSAIPMFDEGHVTRDYRQTVHYTQVQHHVGFAVTEELLEDDVYGDYIQHAQVQALQRAITDP